LAFPDTLDNGATDFLLKSGNVESFLQARTVNGANMALGATAEEEVIFAVRMVDIKYGKIDAPHGGGETVKAKAASDVELAVFVKGVVALWRGRKHRNEMTTPSEGVGHIVCLITYADFVDGRKVKTVEGNLQFETWKVVKFSRLFKTRDCNEIERTITIPP